MKRKATNTHFLLETRSIIEARLNEQFNISDIAKETGRNRSSILREIKRHRKYSFPSIFNNYHPCVKSSTCGLKQMECYLTCKNIEINLCPKLTSSPHVCNPCNSKKGCRHVKIYYKAIEANMEYVTNWKQDRKKLHYDEKTLLILNTDFKVLFFKNRSIYHTIAVFKEKGYLFHATSIYRQIRLGQIDIPAHWLVRPRKNKSTNKDTTYKKVNIEGHTFEDYGICKSDNPEFNEMQMDTVEGIQGKDQAVLLTLQIVSIKFLFIFKLDQKTFANVLQQLLLLQNILGQELFNNLFKILLTDNGIEFYDISTICSTFSNINLFYCHPYSSYEKGSIENNHELLRKIVPKGVSLNPYSQKDFNLICSHINSLYRAELDGKCPFDLIEQFIPLDILNDLEIHKIPAEEVTLNPYLLGQKNIDNIKKYLDDKDIKKAHLLL